MLALLRLAVKPYPRYHRDHDYLTSCRGIVQVHRICTCTLQILIEARIVQRAECDAGGRACC